MPSIPDGFQPLDSPSPFNALVGPYFARQREERLVVGLRLEDKHCNSSGRLHGAMVCAIFDAVIGHNIGLELARAAGEDLTRYAAGVPRTPLVTVSLTTDYIGTAGVGDWLEAEASVQLAGKSTAFANADLRHEGTRIAKASGVYRIFN